MEAQIFFEELQGNFILRQNKVNKPTIIYLRVRLQGKVYKLTTSVKVYPKQWDKVSSSARTGFKYSNLDNQNNQIANEQLSRVWHSFCEFKSYISENPDKISESNKLIRKFIYKSNTKMQQKKEQKKVVEIPATSVLRDIVYKSQSKESSKKQSILNIDKFERFLSTNKIPNTLEYLNLDTIEAYQKFLIDGGLKASSIKNIIKSSLFPILRKASKNNKIDFSWSESNLEAFEVVKDEDTSKQVALTEEEVQTIYDYKPTEEDFNKLKINLDRRRKSVSFSDFLGIKDLFVLQCLTGQRISDLPKLFESKIDTKTKTISITQQKTGAKAVIPLLPLAEKLLKKYKSKDISFYIPDSVNEFIKLICQNLGFIREISYKDRGEEVTKPLYELVHSHTARHTFITIMLRKGVNKEVIQAVTGHKSSKMIDEIYSHLTIEDNQNRVAEEFKKVGLLGNSQKFKNSDGYDEHLEIEEYLSSPSVVVVPEEDFKTITKDSYFKFGWCMASTEDKIKLLSIFIFKVTGKKVSDSVIEKLLGEADFSEIWQRIRQKDTDILTKI